MESQVLLPLLLHPIPADPICLPMAPTPCACNYARLCVSLIMILKPVYSLKYTILCDCEPCQSFSFCHWRIFVCHPAQLLEDSVNCACSMCWLNESATYKNDCFPCPYSPLQDFSVSNLSDLQGDFVFVLQSLHSLCLSSYEHLVTYVLCLREHAFLRWLCAIYLCPLYVSSFSIGPHAKWLHIKDLLPHKSLPSVTIWLSVNLLKESLCLKS